MSELFAREPSSLYKDALHRLLHKGAALVGIAIVFFFLLLAIFAPQLAPHNPLEIFPGNTYRQPMWVYLPNDLQHSGDPRFPLGTDTIGRDVLSRVIYGARTSLAVGLIPLVFILLIGISIGLVAGFFGGTVDNVLMRFTDMVYAFPAILFFILLVTALRDTWLGELWNGLVVLFISLALVSWVTIARLMRAEVLMLKEREFVQAAQSIGASSWRIMVKHILPNSLAPIIVAAAFLIPSAILAEAILGYLGIGIRPSTDPNALFLTSWGSLLLDGRLALRAQPALLIAPAVCIALVMLAFTLIGDALRDALDPWMKGHP